MELGRRGGEESIEGKHGITLVRAGEERDEIFFPWGADAGLSAIGSVRKIKDQEGSWKN